MVISDIVNPLIKTFGLMPVLSLWLLLTGILSVMVTTNFQQNNNLLGLALIPIAVFMPAMSLWMLKLWYEYIPFPPREIFDVQLIDFSSLGILVMYLLGFLFLATEELTGEL